MTDTPPLDVKGKRILAVTAHADDIDFGCAGSIKAWTDSGATVGYFILTDGSKGSEDTAIPAQTLTALRQAEQKAAAAVVGVTDVGFGGFVDGELENSMAVRRAIVAKIRAQKPDIVVTTDPTFVYSEEFGFINHPDHRAAGQAVLDSVFPFARNARTFPDLLDAGLAPHTVGDVLLSNFTRGNLIVDVTGVWETKLEALRQHRSQFTDFPAFVGMLQTVSSAIGKSVGAAYAESFVRISVR